MLVTHGVEGLWLRNPNPLPFRRSAIDRIRVTFQLFFWIDEHSCHKSALQNRRKTPGFDGFNIASKNEQSTVGRTVRIVG